MSKDSVRNFPEVAVLVDGPNEFVVNLLRIQIQVQDVRMLVCKEPLLQSQNGNSWVFRFVESAVHLIEKVVPETWNSPSQAYKQVIAGNGAFVLSVELREQFHCEISAEIQGMETQCFFELLQADYADFLVVHFFNAEGETYQCSWSFYGKVISEKLDAVLMESGGGVNGLFKASGSQVVDVLLVLVGSNLWDLWRTFRNLLGESLAVD